MYSYSSTFESTRTRTQVHSVKAVLVLVLMNTGSTRTRTRVHLYVLVPNTGLGEFEQCAVDREHPVSVLSTTYCSNSPKPPGEAVFVQLKKSE